MQQNIHTLFNALQVQQQQQQQQQQQLHAERSRSSLSERGGRTSLQGGRGDAGAVGETGQMRTTEKKCVWKKCDKNDGGWVRERENEEVSECMGARVREAIKNQHKKER